MEEKNLALLASTKVPEDTDPLANFSGPTGYNSQAHPPIRDQAYSSKGSFGLLAANTPGDEHILLLQSPETPEHVVLGYPGQSYMQNTGSLDYTDVDVHAENTPESDSEHDACHKFLSSLKPPSDGFLDSLTVCDNETKRTKMMPQQDPALPSEKITDSDFSMILESSAQLESEVETWATRCQGQIQSEAVGLSAENAAAVDSSTGEGHVVTEESEAKESIHPPLDQLNSPESKDSVQLLDVDDMDFANGVPPSGNLENEMLESGDESVYV